MNLSPTDIFNERKMLLIGGTGFLGKVTLSMLLHRFPNIGRVYVTVRARSQEESESRFWNSVITAPPFDPLRERYGGALDGFIRDKVVVLGGDIAEPNLGYSEEQAQAIADDIDVVLNSAGNVTFNPTLESALRTNVVGTQNVITFTRRMKRPALIHVSPALSPATVPVQFGRTTPSSDIFLANMSSPELSSTLNRKSKTAQDSRNASAKKPATR
jgi:long-chain acyl-CoA synthetase